MNTTAITPAAAAKAALRWQDRRAEAYRRFNAASTMFVADQALADIRTTENKLLICLAAIKVAQAEGRV